MAAGLAAAGGLCEVFRRSGCVQRAGPGRAGQAASSASSPSAGRAPSATISISSRVWQRALVVAAGPIANFILAFTIFAVVFMAVGVQLRPARVAQVQAGSPAAAAGFQVGDLITGVNGKAIKDGGAVTRTVMLSTGDPVRFTVERGAQTLNLTGGFRAARGERSRRRPRQGRPHRPGPGVDRRRRPPRAIRAGGRRGRGRAPDRRT